MKLQHLLNTTGYSTATAPNGNEALKMIHTSLPRVVLTDVVMPEMDGRELADRLRKTRPELNVLFCSGYTEDIIARRGVLDSGIHFLGKPYTPSDVAQKLRDILDG